MNNNNKTFTTQDEYFMKEALKEGEIALLEGEVPVGCVIVHNNEIIGRGHNRTVATRNGTRHAEFEAFDEILQKNDANVFNESILYVTVEPCIMCASALLLLKIKKVYCGCMNDKFGGCGSVYNVHQHQDVNQSFHNYECISGLFEVEGIELLKRFYEQENPLGMFFFSLCVTLLIHILSS
jgi:tRNA-specific adenosine deaminase 2